MLPGQWTQAEQLNWPLRTCLNFGGMRSGHGLSTLLSAKPAPNTLLVLQDSALSGVRSRETASPQTPQSQIPKLEPSSSSWLAYQDLSILLVWTPSVLLQDSSCRLWMHQGKKAQSLDLGNIQKKSVWEGTREEGQGGNGRLSENVWKSVGD